MQDLETKSLSANEPACRRRRRAQTAHNAVGYQLLHLCEQNGLRAIVIADDFGMPRAHAGDPALSALLAESAMWSGFTSSSVDDLTLDRIQQHYPDVEAHHVASQAIGRAGFQVLAIGNEDAPSGAVRHARDGIARICGSMVDGASFLDASVCEPTPEPTRVTEREHGVRWLIGSLR